MPRARLVLTLVALLSPITTAVARPSAEWSVVQPTEGAGELLLLSRPGRARVELEGRTQGIALRSGEELTEIARLHSGWVAAGRSLDDDGRELVVITDDSQGIRRLPVPVSPKGALRVRPRVLLRDGRLEGLAWLEGAGPRELQVRVSDWSGIDWGPVRNLSATRHGSQTGLAAAILAGGERLLVWSAFDGRDDEIVFSLDEGGGWTPPRRLGPANAVPDVAPAVIAAGDGALAAWNRLDGDRYVLVTARWHDGDWQEPRPLEAEAGLFPELLRIGEHLLLLYRGIEPRGWGVLELDGAGRVLRRGRISDEDSERPALRLLEDGGGISLRWARRAGESHPWSVP